jgi:hypothetical protein
MRQRLQLRWFLSEVLRGWVVVVCEVVAADSSQKVKTHTGGVDAGKKGWSIVRT